MKSLLYFLCVVFTIQLSAQSFSALPNLPEPVSNNAVTHGTINDKNHIFSFCGIDETKEPSGIHLKTFFYSADSEQWTTLPPIIDPNGGKIAASASTVKNKIYIIGGYHVAPNFSEISSSKVHIFNPETLSYEADGADIPVAIDDQVQTVWRDSLIYVITGWSNSTNVTDVQIYDPANDSWSVGTPVPNEGNFKVFGANGTIIGDTIYYLGGARITTSFAASRHLRKGVINPDDPTQITWSGETNLDAIAYRPASFTYEDHAYWIGGSERTYNFDGLAYSNGTAVDPTDKIIRYDPSWPLTEVQETTTQIPPIMDLRGIAKYTDTEFAIAGGMVSGPEVTNQAWLINMAQIVPTENVSSPFFNAYPNPVEELLYINFKGFFEIQIANVLGENIITKNAFESDVINVEDFQNGIYILSIFKNGIVSHSEKIMIQH